MGKKIAIVVRERQAEALRMAVGITLMDDSIDVYVLDRAVEETEENALNLETMKELDMNIYTNTKNNEGLHFRSSSEIAAQLLEYDHIEPY